MQILPAVPGEDSYVQQALRGTVEFVGDVMEPIFASEEWEALGDE